MSWRLDPILITQGPAGPGSRAKSLRSTVLQTAASPTVLIAAITSRRPRRMTRLSRRVPPPVLAVVVVIITGDLNERDDAAGGVADEGGGHELTAGQHHLDGGGVAGHRVTAASPRLQRVIDGVLACKSMKVMISLTSNCCNFNGPVKNVKMLKYKNAISCSVTCDIVTSSTTG